MSYLQEKFLAGATAQGLTGAAGQVATGATFLSKVSKPAVGSLFAWVKTNLTTSSVTLTGKWQASLDGSTWVDVVPMNNAANVALGAGTASLVTTTRMVDAPSACYGAHACRFVVTTSGGGTAGGVGVDDATISYGYGDYK